MKKKHVYTTYIQITLIYQLYLYRFTFAYRLGLTVFFFSSWCIDMHHSLAMRPWKLTQTGLPENGYKHRRIRTESIPTTNARGVGIGCTGLTNG